METLFNSPDRFKSRFVTVDGSTSSPSTNWATATPTRQGTSTS